jgi:hypothetical protein
MFSKLLSHPLYKLAKTSPICCTTYDSLPTGHPNSVACPSTSGLRSASVYRGEGVSTVRLLVDHYRDHVRECVWV